MVEEPRSGLEPFPSAEVREAASKPKKRKLTSQLTRRVEDPSLAPHPQVAPRNLFKKSLPGTLPGAENVRGPA